MEKKVIRASGVHLDKTVEMESADHAVIPDPMVSKVSKDLMANPESEVPREL